MDRNSIVYKKVVGIGIPLLIKEVMDNGSELHNSLKE